MTGILFINNSQQQMIKVKGDFWVSEKLVSYIPNIKPFCYTNIKSKHRYLFTLT